MDKQQDIQSIEDLQALVQQGEQDWQQYGDVNVNQSDDLLVFNYTDAAESRHRWNAFERMSRGLIIHRHTGEVLARAFDKFFNWGQKGHATTSAPMVCATEKMDGSLGILYRVAGEYRIATRNSVKSEQAIWATDFLKRYSLDGLPASYTLLFEIIYPKNRIITNYGPREDLVLIGARNRYNGDYANLDQLKQLAAQYGFSLPKIYTFDSVDEILTNLQQLHGLDEGYVVEFADGQRFKFKGKRYLELLGRAVTFNATLNAVSKQAVPQLLAETPDEFLADVHGWLAEIEQTHSQIQAEVDAALQHAPKDSQKEFAIWVMQHHPNLSPYLFRRMKGACIKQDIYKHAFTNRTA